MGLLRFHIQKQMKRNRKKKIKKKKLWTVCSNRPELIADGFGPNRLELILDGFKKPSRIG
jgi:hypothetical protein